MVSFLYSRKLCMYMNKKPLPAEICPILSQERLSILIFINRPGAMHHCAASAAISYLTSLQRSVSRLAPPGTQVNSVMSHSPSIMP